MTTESGTEWQEVRDHRDQVDRPEEPPRPRRRSRRANSIDGQTVAFVLGRDQVAKLKQIATYKRQTVSAVMREILDQVMPREDLPTPTGYAIDRPAQLQDPDNDDKVFALGALPLDLTEGEGE